MQHLQQPIKISFTTKITDKLSHKNTKKLCKADQPTLISIKTQIKNKVKIQNLLKHFSTWEVVFYLEEI